MTSTQVPPVDLAPGMPSRIVTISATDITEGGQSLAGQTVTFALSDSLDATSGGDVIAKTQATVTLDSDGGGRIRLPVYDDDVKTWCGTDWAILVSASWGSKKAIRVPAGTSTIALSALPNIRPLTRREQLWAITGASVSITEGAQWDVDVSLNGGIIDFDFTVPAGGTAWDRTGTLLPSSSDVFSLDNGKYAIYSAAIADGLGLPVSATGILTSIRWGSNTAFLIFETRSESPETWQTSQFSSGWTDWVRTDATGGRWMQALDSAASDSTLDSLPNGMIAIRSGTIAEALGLPVAVTGFIEKAIISTGSGIATFYARRGTGSQEIYTTTLGSGGWAEWERADAGGVVIPATGLPGQVSVWGSSSPAGVVPELTEALADYGVQVHLKAEGGQWSSQTVANIGSAPISLPIAGGTIPASGSVEINAADSMLDGVDLYLAAPVPLMGWLGGVYGELVGYGTTFSDRGVRFVRAHPGAAVSPGAAPSWVPEVKTPAHLNILGMGKNDVNVGRTQGHLDRLIGRKDSTVAYWQGRGQEFLLLGHFVNNGTPASDAGRTYIEADNADSLAKYPDNFLNMQTLLSGQELWDWTGISPTSEDQTQQSLGNMPPSIQGNGNHLNEAGDRYLSWKIAQWMVARGLIGQGIPPFPAPDTGLLSAYLAARGA